MGVQLRVHGPEVCWRNSAAVTPWVSTWNTPSVPRRVTCAVGLEPAECGVDCGVVCGEDLGTHPRIRAERPQHRHRLRRRERRVEPDAPTCRRTTGRDGHPTAGVDPRAPTRRSSPVTVPSRPRPRRRSPDHRPGGSSGSRHKSTWTTPRTWPVAGPRPTRRSSRATRRASRPTPSAS